MVKRFKPKNTDSLLSLLPLGGDARSKATFNMTTPKKVMKRILLSTSWFACTDGARWEVVVMVRVTRMATIRGMMRKKSVLLIEII